MNGNGNGKRKNPTFEDGAFLTFPDFFKVDPIEIDDFMNLEVGVTQNNGHTKKSRGVLTLRDVFQKYG